MYDSDYTVMSMFLSYLLFYSFFPHSAVLKRTILLYAYSCPIPFGSYFDACMSILQSRLKYSSAM